MRIYYHNSYLDILFDSTSYKKICQYFDNYFANDVTQFQLYDDYITENFIADGYVYYPITLINKKGVDIHWIRWKKKAESLIDCYKKGNMDGIDQFKDDHGKFETDEEYHHRITKPERDRQERLQKLYAQIEQDKEEVIKYLKTKGEI